MLQRALERLRQESARTAQRAAQRMQQAARQLDEDPDAALTEQQQAIEDLEQLRNEIAEERNEAAERLAFELLEKIGDELKSMIAREQTVIDETARLQQLREERGSLTRAQLRSLRDLAEAQAGLHKETEALVARLEPAPVFAVALRGAGRQMKFAAERLDERDTGAETQKRETAARQRLVDLIAALEARPKPPEENAPPPEPPAGEPPMPPPMPNGPPGDRIPPLAELRMLRTLQADLLRRTEELDARAAAGELTPADQRELEELAVEQEELADLARNMAERAAASPPAASRSSLR